MCELTSDQVDIISNECNIILHLQTRMSSTLQNNVSYSLGDGRGGEGMGGEGRGGEEEGRGKEEEGRERGGREERGSEKVKGIIILFLGHYLAKYISLHRFTVKMVTVLLTIDVFYEDGSSVLAKGNTNW